MIFDPDPLETYPGKAEFTPNHADEQQIDPLDKTVDGSADHVRKLAFELFEATQPLHELSAESKQTLEKVIRYESALPSSLRKKAYTFALDSVMSQDDQLDETTRKMIRAILAVSGQGKTKQKNFEKLELEPAQQREAVTLAAILRIANGLDDSRTGATVIRKIDLSGDAVWVVVDGPAAAHDAACARQNARFWSRIGYLPIEVLVPDEAAVWLMPVPEPSEKVGILPQDPLSEAGRKVMRFHFAQMLKHEEGTRLGEDIEALHDMRVATRRMRAAFEVFDQAFKKSALKAHLKGLRATGRALGAVRDLDVFMEKAQKYIDTLPEEKKSGLDPLLQHWKEERDAARREMIDYLNSAEYARFKRNFNIFVNTPFAGAAAAPDDSEPRPVLVRQLAPVLIYERLSEVRAYETLLKDAPIERLHMLRIEFKKFRYTVEYFREVLGKRAYDVIESVKNLQDHLGDLNDAHVAAQILRDFIASWEETQENLPIQERESIEEVVNYLAARLAERHHLLLTFDSAWEAHFNQRAFRRNIAQAVSVL